MNTGSLNEVFVLKTVAKWTYFAYTTQIDTHTRINTGACRSAKTSKLVLIVTKLPLDYKTTLNYKTASGKKQTLKEAKYNTARYENQKPLCGKRECTSPPAEISCGADNSRAKVRKKTPLLELNFSPS